MIRRIRTGRHVPHLKSTSIGFPYSMMEAPAQSPTLANSNNRSERMEDIMDDLDATQATDGSGTQASTGTNQHGRKIGRW